MSRTCGGKAESHLFIHVYVVHARVCVCGCLRYGMEFQGLRALVVGNPYLHVDSSLAGILHDCVNVFSCAPPSRLDLPVYFFCRFLFSQKYAPAAPRLAPSLPLPLPPTPPPTPARPLRCFWHSLIVPAAPCTLACCACCSLHSRLMPAVSVVTLWQVCGSGRGSPCREHVHGYGQQHFQHGPHRHLSGCPVPHRPPQRPVLPLLPPHHPRVVCGGPGESLPLKVRVLAAASSLGASLYFLSPPRALSHTHTRCTASRHCAATLAHTPVPSL